MAVTFTGTAPSRLTNDQRAVPVGTALEGLKKVVQSGAFIPVYCAAGAHSVGVIPLLNGIVDLLPSPVQAKVRVAEGREGPEQLTASDASPLAAYVWKTTADPFVGRMTFFRVFSGSVQADAHVWNQTKGADEWLSGLHLQRGKEQLPAKVIHAGDLGAVAKLTVSSTSDTLCDKNHPVKIPVPKYPAALFRVAIAPKTQADAVKISSTLTRLCEEDMTLSWQNDSITHETVLQGMGDQHIDVAINRAQTKFQVGLVTREPKIPYREGITRKAAAQYRHKKQTAPLPRALPTALTLGKNCRSSWSRRTASMTLVSPHFRAPLAR